MMHKLFSLSALESQRRQTAKPYLEFLRPPHESLSAGIYVLPAGAEDQQSPHAQDEIYYVLRGRAQMRCGADEFQVRPEQIIFVPAREEHKFFDIREELALLVFFAPAEKS
jgi:mannose-6-phosphate isomerase-like protein (cupin superfamily)